MRHTVGFVLGAILFLILAASAGARPVTAAGGAGWQGPVLGAGQVLGVTVLPKTAGTVYAAGAGVYRSTDGGGSWQALTTAFPAAEVRVAPSDPRILYAATGAGCASGRPGALRRSPDGGLTWQVRTGGPAALDIDPTDPNVLLGIGCAGVYRSPDGGLTWTLLPGSGVPNYDGVLLARGVNDRAMLYAVFASEGGTPAIAHSADGGRTWSARVLDTLSGPGDLTVDAEDARRLSFVTFAGFSVSTDAGATWTARNAGLPPATDVYHLSTPARDPASGTWYLGSADPTRPQGVYRLTADRPWTATAPAPGGLPIAQLAFVPAPGGPALLAVTGNGALYRLVLAGAGGPPPLPPSGAGSAAGWLGLTLLGAALACAGLCLSAAARRQRTSGRGLYGAARRAAYQPATSSAVGNRQAGGDSTPPEKQPPIGL